MSHFKPECQFCDQKLYCLQCDNLIDCRQITDCDACGDIFGRPLKKKDIPRIVSSSILLVDLSELQPYLILNYDKKRLSEPGGKFDPSKDLNPMMTAMREFREETGIRVVVTEFDRKWDVAVNKKGDFHRCYILFNRVGNQVYSPFITDSENIITKVPVNILMDNDKIDLLHKRLQMILKYSRRTGSDERLLSRFRYMITHNKL